jgi:hypothetical protein
VERSRVPVLQFLDSRLEFHEVKLRKQKTVGFLFTIPYADINFMAGHYFICGNKIMSAFTDLKNFLVRKTDNTDKSLLNATHKMR